MKRFFSVFLAVLLVFSLAACGSAPRTYEVRFEMNGGTLVSGELLQTIVEGGAATAPVIEREGYVFQGWNESINYITSNKVVVANWEAVSTPAQGTSTGTDGAAGNEAPDPTPAPTPTPDPFDLYYEDLVTRVSAYDSNIAIPAKEATLKESETYDRYAQGAYGQGIVLADNYGGTRIGLVEEGVKSKVLALQEGCAFVRVEDGRYGWLRLDRLVEVFDAKLSHQRKVDYVINDSNYWTADGWREWILDNAKDFPDYVVYAAQNG